MSTKMPHCVPPAGSMLIRGASAVMTGLHGSEVRAAIDLDTMYNVRTCFGCVVESAGLLKAPGDKRPARKARK